MALFIPHRCPKCFESVTLIQPQHKGGAFKGPAKGPMQGKDRERMLMDLSGLEGVREVTG